MIPIILVSSSGYMVVMASNLKTKRNKTKQTNKTEYKKGRIKQKKKVQCSIIGKRGKYEVLAFLKNVRERLKFNR